MLPKIQTNFRLSINCKRALTAYSIPKKIDRTPGVVQLLAAGLRAEMIDAGVAADAIPDDPEAIFKLYWRFADTVENGEESDYYLVERPDSGYWADQPRGKELLHRSVTFTDDGVATNLTRKTQGIPDWIDEELPEEWQGLEV